MIDWPSTIKLLADIINILAVLIGGYFAYYKFFRKREDYSKGILKQSIVLHKVTANKHLLRTTIEINNVGNVPIKPTKGVVVISKLCNGTSTDIDKQKHSVKWLEVARNELNLKKEGLFIEPGENDTVWSDFLLEDGLNIIDVYSEVYCGEEYGNFHWYVSNTIKIE